MEASFWSYLVRILALAAGLSVAGLLWGAASQSDTEVLALQIRVLRGEGLISPVGSRCSHALVVQISDETGRPVQGATVSFRLPDQGSGGVFRGGLKTDIAVTGADGQARMGAVRWNETPGAFYIHVVAAKDRARAGIMVPQYLAGKTVARIHSAR